MVGVYGEPGVPITDRSWHRISRFGTRAVSIHRKNLRAESYDLPDDRLIEQIRSGDPDAFELMVERYQDVLLRLARQYLRNDADAEDVTQHAFLRAFLNFSTFRKSSSLRYWLSRIVIHLSLNVMRDRARLPPEPWERHVLPCEPWMKKERRRLMLAIEQLPRVQRTVVELRIRQDLSFKEIGHAVGCSAASAGVN
jgi:RNA polymerase sigma-70 factor (ECF subfamily)